MAADAPLPLLRLDSLDDERLDAYARLTDTALRNTLEPERGLFIAEGDKVIDRALDAGCMPLSALLEDRMPAAARHVAQRMAAEHPSAPLFALPPEQMERLTGYQLTRGALAAFRRPVKPSVEAIVANARRIAVLEDITNFTNVGAVFRSAAALGIDAVLVTPGCYDPLYRRAIRVSMGTVFQVPWTTIGSEVAGRGAHGNVERKGGWSEEGIPLLHRLGFTVACMALAPDAIPLDSPVLQQQEKLALVLGTEGDGLSENTIACGDMSVIIPMAHGVDSLNVAAASAVAFWQLCASH